MFTFFEKQLDPFPPEPAVQPPKSVLAFCIHYTQSAKKYLAGMAILSALTAMIEVSLFGFMGNLIDWLNSTTPENLWNDVGSKLMLVGLLLLVGIPSLVTLRSLLVHQTLLGNYPMAIRWKAHRYLLNQSIDFFQDEFAGRISTKIMQTALAVRETVMKVLDVAVYICIYFGSMIVLMSLLDLRFAIPMVLWIVIYITLLGYFLPKLGNLAARQADARSEMTGRIVDTYTNIATVKLFSYTNRESSYAREGMEKFLQTVHPQMRLVTMLNTCVWTLNALLIFSLGSLSIYLWSNAFITTGAIAAGIGMALRLNGMSQWIMWEISSLFENIGTVKDGINTLSQAQSVVDIENAPALNVTHGAIDFKQICFHYGKNEGVIEQFSLQIKPGEKIGLVGHSGAGKSTLVNLLLRFYDVEKGAISIDGQAINKVTQESLRQHIGMVTQDTSLLHRSVRDNLLYGRPDATDEDMIAATKQAQAYEFIQSLEDSKGRKGFDAHVGERGVKLSGGQRQRIAIARVLIKDAPILILDEATSALDSEVESIIQGNLQKLMENKTVIAIAHRLSTIAALDRLIILDKGKIVEQGSHAELIAMNGLYAQLWAHQSGGFLGEN